MVVVLKFYSDDKTPYAHHAVLDYGEYGINLSNSPSI